MSPASPKAARGLGRGLDALLGEGRREPPAEQPDEPTSGPRLVPVSAVHPNPGQPRRHFAEEALRELADSIRARGLIQPIVVRPKGDRFEIVAGERRWRAAQIAQLHEIPALICPLDDAAAYEIALIENVQREDLNAIEEAEGYRRLVDEFGHSQGALAKLVDKSRSHISNLLRLLELPEPVRALVRDGRLSMGHARALIGRPDAETIARRAVDEGLSVRDVERLTRRPRASQQQDKSRAAGSPDADIRALEEQLADLLGLKVRIADRGGAGSLSLEYRTLDQLDMLCQRLSGESF